MKRVPAVLTTIVAAVLTAGLISGPAHSAPVAPPGPVLTGSTLVQRVPFAASVLSEQPANGPVSEPAPWNPMVVVPRVGPAPAGPAAAPQASAGQPPSILAPVLSRTFVGLQDNNLLIPPDTVGCAGPSHLVSFLNPLVGVFQKSDGLKLSQVSLSSFMTTGLGIGTDAFDPKVLYDQHSGRYIAVCLNGRSWNPQLSHVILAVSASSDPTGTWYRWAIDADKDNGVQTTFWTDYPGLGVDASAVYITANMYDTTPANAFEAKVWCIPKAQLLTGTAVLTWSEFFFPWGITYRLAQTIQPCHTYGTPPGQYFTHFVNWSGAGSDEVNVWRLTDPLTTPTMALLTPAVAVTGTPDTYPDAPQLGSAQLIETNDERLINAQYRNDRVWTTNTVGVSGRTGARCYELNVSGASPTLEQEITLSHATGYYYFPSVAVNSRGDVAVGFTASSPTDYASACYTARLSGAAAGSMQPVSVLKAGEASYFKDFSTGFNRWGDYSATCVDPADDITFWTLQEYAWTSNRWSTWWGCFDAAVAPVSLASFTAKRSGGTVALRWVTESEVDVGGYYVLRAVKPEGPYVRVSEALIPAREGRGRIYTFTDRAAPRGSGLHYKLEEVGLQGARRAHGPVVVAR